jgi:hypothetical protein
MRTRRACKLLATITLVFAACTATSSEPGPAGPPREGGVLPQPSEPAPAPSPSPSPAPGPAPGIGQACAAGVCAAGLSCVEYYGIAGPRGPKFTSCEVRCDSGACPSGLTCTTIADGPGAVCRPATAQASPPAPVPSTPAAEPARPGVGQACAAGVCAAGLSCVEYYGIAGPRGPKFTSCEVRCSGKGSTCPSGMACTTIADGPGAVCRPHTAQAPAPTPAPAPADPASNLGASCAGGKACAAGLECVEYYGVAGARGPKFESCEIKCAGGKGKSKGCPKGTICVTISDGPGSVCRPANRTQLPPPSQQGEVR